MSKIEKALKRSGGGRQLTVVRPTTDQTTASKSRQMAALASSELEARAQSTGAIATMREQAPRSKGELDAARIIYPEMGESPTVKSFREIRTKILQATLGRNCTVMVTGVTAKSGTTFVATNLSAAFAFDEGKTALLVDCNLRNPQLHQLIRGDSANGLADYLENSAMDPADIIHPIGIERVRVIPAGGRREAPGEYFTSVKMKQLLETVRNRYPERFIILDSPPMTESADTQILADLCDYIVLVVPYGTVTRSHVDACVKAMDRNKLLGIVFNNEPRLPDFRRKKS